MTTSETAKRPPGFKTRNVFANDFVLVGGEIDDAIGDDDVDGIVGKGNVLDFAFQEFDVFDAGLLLILVRQSQHFVGHIETVGFAGWADAPGGEQHINAAAGAQIEHDFAGIEFRQRGWIAAAERSQQGFRGNLA